MPKEIQLGLRQNWKQFTLLVIVNAFVGGMVGMERSIFPKLAETAFGLTSPSIITSFIVVFGFTKAIFNYISGKLSAKIGRKKVLVLGWIFAIPIPFLIIHAPTFGWVVFANFLLGINQGLAWSSTVTMKIDLVGEKQRGFAMGLNEFAGYISVALVAMLTGFIANKYGIRPYSFYIGIVLSIAGILVSVFLIQDTQRFVNKECEGSATKRLGNVFLETTWTNHQLGATTQAGLVNNLNDGMFWGIIPMLLAQQHFQLSDIGMIVGVYPAVWGFAQLITGKMADLYSKKWLMFFGMLIQAIVLFCMLEFHSLSIWMVGSALLGIGTALVYPTFLANIAENTHPADRAEALGVFRFWRDSGYAIGAILSGLIAGFFGLKAVIFTIAALTLFSAFVIIFKLKSK